MMNEDMLESIFKHQIDLQKRLAPETLALAPGDFPLYGGGTLSEEQRQILYKNVQVQGYPIIKEATELIDCTPWKNWSQRLGSKKTYPEGEGSAEHIGDMREELIDMLHFWVNLALSLGMTPQDVHKTYCYKNSINHLRKDSGGY